ncbi:SDR family oxidoreductase [Nocardia sp. NBC_01329]|uniref:SDR family oxidoreductase n=1 Tax=Nocardia sp. NBC_01329 TaxID=2903594 RepID=UPI002E0F18DE|nr:NAD(P)H-binding protein [Nocardia sp. NBC_01329]
MRIAVVGANGRTGTLTRVALERAGHDVVPIGRSYGIDVLSGEGLADAFTGVEAVVDVTNSTAVEEEETVRFFTTATRNLLAAERTAGVGHHIVLTIAGLGKVKGNAHYVGKRAQEAEVEAGAVPYTIVPATQFHDFAAMVASWTEKDGVSPIAPLLIQPIAPSDVAAVLARVAVGPAQGRHADIAGPDPQDLVDMARRTHLARGQNIALRPSWENGIFDVSMAGNILLPAAPEIAPTSFDDWLDGEATRIEQQDID